jgi:pentatricopeptide repeat protein
MKDGHVDHAWRMFDEMAAKGMASWTSVGSVY